MDACVRVRGVPVKARSSVRKEIISENSFQSTKTLLKSRKELCSVVFEDHQKDPVCMFEINFVSVPNSCGEVDVFTQAQSTLSTDICDLLRSLNIQTLKEEEVLLIKDVKKNLGKMSTSQPQWPKAVCVLKYSPMPQSNKENTVFNLLCKYINGIRFALELHSLLKNHSDHCQGDDDDTNQSVSSIEDDFVTAFEHLEEEEDISSDNNATIYNSQSKLRDVGSQTVSSQCTDTSGSKIIMSSCQKKLSKFSALFPDASSSRKDSIKTTDECTGSPQTYRTYSPQKIQNDFKQRSITSISLTESDESECSSPSPIIFLDEEGYQRSLEAKIEIPKLPVLKDGVEDSDSELSEFFDSFDQFDELDHLSEKNPKPLVEKTTCSQTQKRKMATQGCCATAAMNPHRFDHSILPANVKKPTPLKPDSPYSIISDGPDSPWPVKTSGEDPGALFSPIRSSAFSPLSNCTAADSFCKTNEEHSEIKKPQELCALYKTYSDYASSISHDIMSSVFGYNSSADMNVNKNLSCVCHMKFKNSDGHFMKLADFQPTDSITKLKYTSQTFKDGIQRFATDLVEKSIGSAFKDLQKGVSSCTSKLCHLAARLTTSVFQMAFHEIGMRHAYVLKERAINGLASFLVGEALSGALKEFCFVKKQIFNNTVARFAADLAEELVFEGIMEVCQFSHPPTPSSPKHWSLEEEEKVVLSYANDLSESVLQEAFIELSQADVTFTTQAAISVSLDNIRYVRAESAAQATNTCNTSSNHFGLQHTSDHFQTSVHLGLLCASGVASCAPLPIAGKIISDNKALSEIGSAKSYNCYSEVREKANEAPKIKSNTAFQEQRSLVGNGCHIQGTDPFLPSATYTFEHKLDLSKNKDKVEHKSSETASGRGNCSGAMVDLVVNEGFELVASSKVKKTMEECAEYVGKKIIDKMPSVKQLTSQTPYPENLTQPVFKHTHEKVKPTVSNPYLDQIALSVTEQDVAFPMEVKTFKCIKSLGHCNTSISCNPVCPGQNKDYTDDVSNCILLHGNNEIRRSDRKMLSFRSAGLPSCLKESQNRERRNEDTQGIQDLRNTLEIPGCEASMPSPSNYSNMKVLYGMDCIERNFTGSPGTPPSTPQQPQHICQNKKIKQFSKQLKGKLAKEFSPAPPPSTPHSQSDVCGPEISPETEKTDFMLRLMRSLSDELEGSEDEEDEENQSVIHVVKPGKDHMTTMESDVDKGAVSYADHLACHIVSMATGMSTLCKDERNDESRARSLCNPFVGQFPEHSLNSLWTYAGEIAGEVISDVKKMISLNQCRRKPLKRHDDILSYCSQQDSKKKKHEHERIYCLAERTSNEVLSSVLGFSSSSDRSDFVSKCPSYESVSDEYAGHVIKVLKREDENSELVLDQYASKLAYRSVKSGLAQAARKIKQRCNLRLYSTRRPPFESRNELLRFLTVEHNQSMKINGKVNSDQDSHLCTCRPTEEMSPTEHMKLLAYAESLAYSITYDVTRKLRSSSLRLPKSLTDSCLYKKSKLEGIAENFIKTNFSCSLLPYKPKNKQYHSTGSLNDCHYSDSVIQVIEHYARKIVDDTLEMTISTEDRRKTDSQTDAKSLSETSLKTALVHNTCGYCTHKEHPFYFGTNSNHRAAQVVQQVSKENKQDCDQKSEPCCSKTNGCGYGIPKIHIDLEQKSLFAEQIVSSAIEKAKREISSTSLNADSGIGHDGASFAESITTEIMTSAMLNACQTIHISASGKEGLPVSESSVSHQPSLSVGDDSTGSWSNLSFEDEHADESSSFLHMSDSNGNSSSWSSLGLEGDIYEESLSFSPSDSEGTEDKETESKDILEGGLALTRKGILLLNTEIKSHEVEPQLRTVLQWVAASHSEMPVLQFAQPAEKELSLLPFVLKRAKDKNWKVGDLLQAVLRYYEHLELEGETNSPKPLFEWLLNYT
ncbi:A-kinase anchor protein 11 isoform X1 [Polypterus senegalus]|uniref:A-kinase anchor protein 11 isoform X1 n=1 Tax=Polypterus senegalus TaxID=55291 RepID=UPI001965EA15|nr:A-kinase anchor protein 11 isoform X1 [Polypterus senegalus]